MSTIAVVSIGVTEADLRFLKRQGWTVQAHEVGRNISDTLAPDEKTLVVCSGQRAEAPNTKTIKQHFTDRGEAFVTIP